MSKRMLITAGPTREMLDPVRFLSNRSTGEMGYAIAEAAKSHRYKVTLISGPTGLVPPKGVKFVQITSARELQKACKHYFPKNDILVMTAAVCDYAPSRVASQKIKRKKSCKLVLKQTPDIVAGLSKHKGRRRVIGFCLETQDWIQNAKMKCRKKGLDGIVANLLSHGHDPFGQNRPRTAFINMEGRVRLLQAQSKKSIGLKLIKWIEQIKDSHQRGLT